MLKGSSCLYFFHEKWPVGKWSSSTPWAVLRLMAIMFTQLNMLSQGAPGGTVLKGYVARADLL